MPSAASMPELDAGQVHYEWNNAIAPRLEIEPGDTVVFRTRDAAECCLYRYLPLAYEAILSVESRPS